jgi:hypothetical protein
MRRFLQTLRRETGLSEFSFPENMTRANANALLEEAIERHANVGIVRDKKKKNKRKNPSM